MWFQNARANWKKYHKASAEDLTTQPTSGPLLECKYCQVPPTTAKYYQQHVFSAQHLQQVAAFVGGAPEEEAGGSEDEDDLINSGDEEPDYWSGQYAGAEYEYSAPPTTIKSSILVEQQQPVAPQANGAANYQNIEHLMHQQYNFNQMRG